MCQECANLAVEELFKLICDSLLHSRQNVTVGVEGEHNRGVSKPLTNHFRVLIGQEQKRGARVTQFVERVVLSHLDE